MGTTNGNCICGERSAGNRMVYYNSGNGKSIEVNLSKYCLWHGEIMSSGLGERVRRLRHKKGDAYSIDTGKVLTEYEREIMADSPLKE